MMTRRRERGASTAVEAAVIVPALLLIVGLVVVLARVALAEQTVGGAAAQAARAASVERTVFAAITSAQAVAASTLRESGVACLDSNVAVQAAGLLAPVGQPSIVTVTVTCQADLGVGLPGLPTTRTLTATKSSPVDSYRSR